MQRNFKSEYLAARGIGGESRRLFASGAGNETPQSPTATCCRLARVFKLLSYIANVVNL